MPRERSAQPAYQYHASGQAKVRLADKDFYLGKHGTPESYARYYALLAEYNANGRQAPGDDDLASAEARQGEAEILVKHITADFRARVLPFYADKYNMRQRYENLLDLLDHRHGEEPASDFGPRKLEAIRDVILRKGIGEKGRPNSRRQANELVRNIISVIGHGVSRELVGPNRIVALESLTPLKKGQAKDNPKRSGVPLDVVRATLEELSGTLQAMVRLQLATAMRPGEVCQMTPSMIDRSGEVWLYRPEHHKTEHHGKLRTIPLLGDALDALTPFMFGDPCDRCFKTTKGTPWNKDSYRREVERAAKRAKVEHWTPYRLRHTTLQAVRDAAGAEAAQALGGHSRLSTTEIYAKANEARAIEAARAVPKIG